jgi:hypothetical protein
VASFQKAARTRSGRYMSRCLAIASFSNAYHHCQRYVEPHWIKYGPMQAKGKTYVLYSYRVSNFKTDNSSQRKISRLSPENPIIPIRDVRSTLLIEQLFAAVFFPPSLSPSGRCIQRFYFRNTFCLCYGSTHSLSDCPVSVGSLFLLWS